MTYQQFGATALIHTKAPTFLLTSAFEPSANVSIGKKKANNVLILLLKWPDLAYCLKGFGNSQEFIDYTLLITGSKVSRDSLDQCPEALKGMDGEIQIYTYTHTQVIIDVFSKHSINIHLVNEQISVIHEHCLSTKIFYLK